MDGRPNCRNKAEFFKFLWRREEAFKKLTVMLAKVMLQETCKQSPKTKPGKSWQKTQTKRLMSARYATFSFPSGNPRLDRDADRIREFKKLLQRRRRQRRLKNKFIFYLPILEYS